MTAQNENICPSLFLARRQEYLEDKKSRGLKYLLLDVLRDFSGVVKTYSLGKKDGILTDEYGFH